MTSGAIKVIGVAASVVSVAASLASGWVQEKKIDENIATKVAEEIAKQTEKK